MAYTFLDNSLNTIGVLTNKGGQTNDYWGDSITHEIATSQDVLTSVSLSVDKPSVNIDTSGNQKTWNHVIQGLSFNIDGIGRKVNENDYLIYQEGTNGKYYLMAITQVDESAVQSGFHYKTVQGLNAAAYDLSRKTLRAKSFAQIPDNTQEKGTAKNILKYIFEDINWDVRTIGSFGAIDYDIAEGTTAQAVLLDIIGMFEAEVDAYVQLNNWGKGANVFNKNGSIKRIFDFSTSLGKYRGETVRYNKNMVSITKTGARDSMYTKLYVNGNNITIADANKGADFIVDDVANRKYNKLGSVSTPVTYLEGIITNSAIESPTALLAWGKKQLKILNHPRYNYQISATNDDKVQLGDTVIIQDTHASDPIYLKSKVISKTVSLADPTNNSFIVGEFSPIVIGADNGLEDTNQIMQLVNQANQTAINAQNKANENAKKIVDTRTNLEKTIDQKLQEGKYYSDSLDQKQKEAYNKFEVEINKGLEDAQKERDEISKKADDMLTTANSYADTMYSNAVSTAKDEASKALTSANEALDEAKTDLTTNLNKETEDRNKAVLAVNSQAQDYANQAKSDALNTIAKEVTDRQNAVSALDTKATNAVNQAKSDINDTINALSVGGRNLLLNTADFSGNTWKLRQTAKGDDYGSLTTRKTNKTWDSPLSSLMNLVDRNVIEVGKEYTFSAYIKNTSENDIQVAPYGIPSIMHGDIGIRQTVKAKSDWQRLSATFKFDGLPTAELAVDNSWGIRWESASGIVNGNLILAGYKLEQGNLPTDWTPAPEDVVLDYTTKDNKIKETITQYQETNDGNVSKAQTDATTALGLVKTKVSQTDYNKKTGDLSTKYTQVKQTADSQATDIANIKKTATSQASKINSISSDVNGTKQSISDIETTQDSQSDKINQITSDVNGTKQLITDIQTRDGKQDTRMGTIETSVSGIKSDFSSYKTTNDSAVHTAQTTAQTAVDGLKTKVSQTDYNTKTGKLQTDLTETSQTANQAKSDIVAIKSEADSQSAQINDIVSDAKGTKQTISDIKTEQGKQSGSIATLQSRADGFDATVTKVNNLSVGGRNLYITATQVAGYVTADNGRIFGQTIFKEMSSDYIAVSPNTTYTFQAWGSLLSGQQYWSVIGQYDSDKSFISRLGGLYGVSPVTTDVPNDYEKTTFTTSANTYFVRVSSRTFGNYRVKFEKGDVPTDWTPAPEDLSSATAKAQLTADKANLDLSTYKTDADGRISKAQSDITATAKEVKTKVSQSDYNDKTNDLTKKYGQVKATADAVTTDVAKYKKSNDGRVSATESSIETLSGQITSKVSQSDFNKKTGELSGNYTETKQTIKKISNTVTELQTKVNQQGQINHLNNSEFDPDLEGWDTSSVGRAPYRSYFDRTVNHVTVGFNTMNDGMAMAMLGQKVTLASTPGARGQVSLSWQAHSTDDSKGNQIVSLTFYDSANKKVGDTTKGDWSEHGTGWTIKKIENVAIPDNATSVQVLFYASEKVVAYLVKPMLTFEKTIGDYVPGNYNNNTRVTALELDVNGIHGTVNDPKKGLSATWDLANHGQTLAVQAQKDAKTADGKAVAAQKDATTAVTTAKGTQTTVTSVQKDVKDLQTQQTVTAGQVTTEIKDRQKGDTNTLTQAKNFTSSSITKSETGLRTEIQQSASGVVAQVQHVNRLFNTQFTPDLQGWSVDSTDGKHNPYRSYVENKYGATYVGYNNTTVTTKSFSRMWQIIDMPGTINTWTKVSLSWVAHTNQKDNYTNLWLNFYDSKGTQISATSTDWGSKTLHATEELKWENIDVPDGTKTMRVSFEAREGTNAYLANPMLTFTPKAQTYMPGGYHSTSTVLELFDGRFALGIKNNTGNIISGINGDSSGLSIVGKKITVSGDTTFLGKNFMDGALIKNASIDSAKIKNLEVDKLTGNTTNFVKSSWDNAYGNQLFINGDNIAFFTNSRRSATTLSEGRIHMAKYNNYTKITESVGGIKHSLYPRTQNQDYLNIYLDGWGKQGGHGSGAAAHGGDGILFSVSDGDVQKDGPGTRLLEWDNELLASTQGIKKGWHFWDFTEVNGEDFMVTPKSAYQGLRIGSYRYNGTTYPTIMGDQMKGDGPGILMGSTEMYFLYKKKVYKLADILKGSSWKV